MSTIYGKVLDKEINVDVKKADKSGTYKGYRIAYKTEDGEVRELAKAMQSLKFTPSVAEALASLAPGDEFTLVQEKNEKGFLDVKSLTKGKIESTLPDGEKDAPTTVSIPQSRPNTGKVIGSTYETPEERKLKQRLIVRQAALNQAISFCGTDVNISTITETAAEFEEWVYRGL